LKGFRKSSSIALSRQTRIGDKRNRIIRNAM
jgi:hypothetical protein